MSRPTVPGWKNINLNKPEEYSSEFTVDGNRYANVTNVTTGQRQLYLVSGLGGTLLTQRSLLVTTNSDGSRTNGEAYTSYINTYGNGKLQNALINNKKQSNFIIQKASTPEEKTSLSQTSEYKGSIGNVEEINPDNQEATPGGSTPTDPNPETPKQQPTPQLLKYPQDLHVDQDTIKFTAVQYIPPGLGEQGTIDRKSGAKKSSLGTVTLPIQSMISDSNRADWNPDQLNEFYRMALNTVAGKESIIKGTATKESLEKGIKGAIEKFKENDEQMLAALGQYIIGIESNLVGRTGGVLNQNLELLFTGPTLRPFTFNFKMIARDGPEGEVIKRIINFFKRNMAPKKGNQLFLKAPNTFMIEYTGNGEQGLNKIKECALLACNVTYTPNGTYMTYEDGTMVEYQMTLSFNELEPVYDTDYDDHPIGY